MYQKDPAPKKDNRGGRRPNTGPKRSFVWLEIGEDLLKNLKEYCHLRTYLDYERVDPDKYLQQILIDRLDSPFFAKSLERLREEKRRKDSGEEDSQDDDF